VGLFRIVVPEFDGADVLFVVAGSATPQVRPASIASSVRLK
jgi:hypothetical protein